MNIVSVRMCEIINHEEKYETAASTSQLSLQVQQQEQEAHGSHRQTVLQ